MGIFSQTSNDLDTAILVNSEELKNIIHDGLFPNNQPYEINCIDKTLKIEFSRQSSNFSLPFPFIIHDKSLSQHNIETLETNVDIIITARETDEISPEYLVKNIVVRKNNNFGGRISILNTSKTNISDINFKANYVSIKINKYKHTYNNCLFDASQYILIDTTSSIINVPFEFKRCDLKQVNTIFIRSSKTSFDKMIQKIINKMYVKDRLEDNPKNYLLILKSISSDLIKIDLKPDFYKYIGFDSDINPNTYFEIEWGSIILKITKNKSGYECVVKN